MNTDSKYELTASASVDGVPNVQQATVTIDVSPNPVSQTINFNAVPTQVANSSLALMATASSGLPISFTSDTPTICTVNGTTALLLAAGNCSIEADQFGNATYVAASATQSFLVSFAPQTIAFATIPTMIPDQGAPLALTATASSGLPVSFTSTTPTICTVNGTTVSLLGPGTCTIQAYQAGNATYSAAAAVTQSFSIGTANLQLGWNFGSIGNASTAATLVFTFSTADTLGSIDALTQGATGLDFANAGTGTCTAGSSYNAGNSCTVNVTFTPTCSGTRYGAIVLKDVSGNVIATGYLQGTGVGPQVNFLPGAESKVETNALSNPSGVTVDGSGNIYIADSGNNRVLKETRFAGGYTESTVPTSALSDPSGVAVDGSGNLYIVDTYNNRVLKEVLSAGSYTESTMQTSALNGPSGVAVDGSGNVYIADTGSSRVLMENLSAGSYTETSVPTSSLYPYEVAVDGSGNVYIADIYYGLVLKETLSFGSYIEGIVPTSALYPQGVAVDGNGNVYIADTGNNRVLKEDLSGGSYTESTVPTSALNGPYGVAADGSGNVFIADTGNNRVLKEDLADPPSLSFAPTAPGLTSSDSPQTVTVENVGNAVLNFPIPSSGSNPSIAANFTLNNGGATTCPLLSAGSSTAGTLVAGQSCWLAISFTPLASGAFSGAVALTDNALNGAASGYATQSISLSGVGTGSTQQTITFESIPAQTANSTLALTATASSGLPVSLSSTTPTICTVSGSTASLLAAGTCTIQATQAGSTTYAAATDTQSFTVNLAAQTITFDAIPAQIINTSVPVLLRAGASSGLTVSLASTTPTICTASHDPYGNLTATLLAPGTCTIQASQAGDGVVYAAALTVSQSFSVSYASPLSGPNFGAMNIGTASPVFAVSLTFGTEGTLGTVSVLTQGATGLDFANGGLGTCAVETSYNAGATCTVSVTFTPTRSGSRYGAVVLQDGSGNVIATSYLQGTGVGPQVNFLPGAESTVPSSALYLPTSVAVDGSGSVYIADDWNNRVLKETLSAGSYTESTVPTSALSHPAGIVVDGGGNIYIVDTYHNRVLKETLSAGSYTETTVPTSALSGPEAVAVDGSGNVYIADTYNNRVLMETLSAGSYSESTVPTSFLASAHGIAVDGSGNIYIANSDYYDSTVLKETLSAGSYSESTVPTSPLSNPCGVAVDAGGDVYITDPITNRVLKEALSAGSYTESTVQTSALNPQGVAVDGSGNVFIADTGNNRVLKEDFADPPSLSFNSINVGMNSVEQTVTVQNIGNAPLTLPLQTAGSNPSITQYFALDSSAPTACPVVTTLSAGTLDSAASCTLSISFDPTVSGNINGSLVLTDNALNAASPIYATQTIALQGTGTGTAQSAQTITVGTPAPASAAYNSQFTVAATASSGLTVAYTSSGGCTNSGATFTMTSPTTACSVIFNQAGNISYSAATQVTETVTATTASQTITVTGVPATAQPYGTNFMVGYTGNLGTGPVTFTATGACAAVGNSVTIDSGSGICSVAATIAADNNYLSATSAPSTVAVTQAAAVVNVPNVTQTYNGSPVLVTGTTSPIGLTLTYSYAGVPPTVYSASTNAPTNPGTYSVTASVFDPNYMGQGSGTLTINQLSSALSLNLRAGTSDPSPYGTMVYFDLTMATSPCPTGTVQFYLDGAAPGSPVALSGASCALPVTFQTAILTPGTHSVYAIYGGDTYYSNATSGSVSQTVSQDTVSVTLSSSGSPVNVGSPVTFTATVNPSSLDPSAQPPAGTVEFFDVTDVNNPIQIGSSSLSITTSPYTASYATSALAAGAHSISATFVDTDGLFVGSSSSISAETVNLLVPTINWPYPANIVYGTALSTTQLDATATNGNGNTVAGNFNYNPPATTILAPGTTNVSVTFTPNDPTTWATQTMQVPITIVPATLTVTPNNQSRTYGTINPVFTYQISGFVNNDPPAVVTGAPACSTSAAATSPVTLAGYPITCTQGTLGTTSGYYNFQFQSGTLMITQASPLVSWSTAPPSSAVYHSQFTVMAASNSTGTISYTTSGGCNNSGGTVTMTSGTTACAVTANVATDTNYTAGAIGPNSVNATLASQTITVTGVPARAQTYGSSFTVGSTGSLGTGAVTFTATGACANSGNHVTMTSGTGACSVTATIAADNDYISATSTPPATVAAALASQTITVGTPAPASAAYDSQFTVAATASSGLTVAYTSAGGCTNSGATFTMTSPASACSVIFNQAGNTNYKAATQVTETVTATKATQTITVGTPAPSSAAYNSQFTVAATASSGLTVAYTSSGGCTNSGATFTMTSPTTACSVIFNQAGNADYNAATQVTEPVTATKASQTITVITPAPASAAYNSQFTVAAKASSGLTLAYTSAGGCTNSAATFTMKSGTTSCTVQFNQAGNTNYSAATQVTETVSATLATQATLTVTGVPTSAQAYGANFTVGSSGGSGTGAVTFNGSGACSASGTKVTMTSGTGTCPVTATKAADTNYASATSAASTVSATLATQAITVTTPAPSRAAYNSQFTVVAKASSGLTVAYTSTGGCTNSGATYTMTSPTTACSVIFNQAGNANYSAATQVTETVTATKASQTITVTSAAPASAAYGSQFTVAATASSGLAVTYASSGGCTNSSAIFTMTSSTTACTVTYSQAGNSNYAAASNKTNTTTATKAPLTITANNQSKTYGQALTLGTTAFTASGLQNGQTVGSVTLTSSGASASASVSGSPYTIVPSAATGGTFTANNYTITYVAGSLAVNKASNTTAVTATSPVRHGTAFTVSFSVAAQYTGTPTGTVTVTVNDESGATCNGTLSGGSGSCSMTLNNTGTWTLTASYPGDTNFTSSSGSASHTVN